ncbi:MAG: hypothetical protein LBI10_05125 [Deltaproteobacteria bacterium]|nr:hypothetical protein [Deltaproteobacteria bacterium]
MSRILLLTTLVVTLIWPQSLLYAQVGWECCFPWLNVNSTLSTKPAEKGDLAHRNHHFSGPEKTPLNADPKPADQGHGPSFSPNPNYYISSGLRSVTSQSEDFTQPGDRPVDLRPLEPALESQGLHKISQLKSQSASEGLDPESQPAPSLLVEPSSQSPRHRHAHSSNQKTLSLVETKTQSKPNLKFSNYTLATKPCAPLNLTLKLDLISFNSAPESPALKALTPNDATLVNWPVATADPEPFDDSSHGACGLAQCPSLKIPALLTLANSEPPLPTVVFTRPSSFLVVPAPILKSLFRPPRL